MNQKKARTVIKYAYSLVGGVCAVLFFVSNVQAQSITSYAYSEIAAAASGPSHEVVIPNDPLWDRQWYLRQIKADQAWTVTTGTPDVIVAVIDVGVDITHPDIREAIWTNPREIPGDGVDNDRNGYTDDVHGWNFVTKTPSVYPLSKSRQSEDAWSHGTMVASLIGARGNDGLGMVGVAWNVRIMPLVALDASGGGDTQNIIQAVRYATNMGADVINLSLAGSEEDPSLTEMIERAAGAGVVVVAAIGNDDTEKAGGNIDEKPSYPACGERQQDSVIGVGGTDALDQKAPYANFGKRCTDISAPAYDILADRPSYERGLRAATNLSGSVMNYREGTIGTSVAAPLVAGAAALLKSIHPTWTVTQIRERLYATADPLTQEQVPGQKTVLGYGRLNIGRALLDPVVTSTPSPESKPLLPVAKKGSKKKSVPVALPPASPARTDTSRITP